MTLGMKTAATTRREEQRSLCTSLRSRIILHQDDDFFVCDPVSGSLGLSSSDSDADGAVPVLGFSATEGCSCAPRGAREGTPYCSRILAVRAALSCGVSCS